MTQRPDEKKRHKSRKSRRRASAHSSDSELEPDHDEDQIRAYEPTSPAQWSSHHRQSTASSINGRLHADSPSSAAPQAQRRAPIDRLPPELLIHIFRQLIETPHFYSCLFVSSIWCQCVVELLWLKPHLSTQASLLSFLAVIKPGFNPNAPDINGELSFDSREVLVNGHWDRESTEKSQKVARPKLDVQAATLAVDPLFPYARFVRRINLSGVPEEVHDAHFLCLAACVRLERLTLTGCIHLTDTSLSTVIAHMNQLVAVDLTGVIDVTDATILVVATASNRLQGINLEGCKKITDTGIHAIADNCPMLRRIKLCDLDLITGTSVSKLVKNCPLLIEIDLNSCVRVGELAARDIWSSCFHLRELRLAQCILIGDSAFPVPPKVAPQNSNPSTFPALDQGMSRLILPISPPLLLSRSLVHLRQLDLMALQITDEAVVGIVANAPKLRNLVLAKCSLLTDRAVRSIAGLGRHLQFLHLGHAAAITDASITHLAKTCVRLRYVDLACCTSLTNESVRALSALPKLRRIGLVRVMNLTDQAVEYLTARHNTLERVHLSYCEQITVKAIRFLLQRLDKLTHLSLTGVPAFRNRELQRFCRHPPSNFNELQRSAFCVYSGAGIQNLRKYLGTASLLQHEYSSGPADVDGDHGGSGQPFGDPQLSDTDDEGDDRDMSSHFLLPDSPPTNAPQAAASGSSGGLSTIPVDMQYPPPQSNALHQISRSSATPGTSRQSRGSRSASTATGSSRHTQSQAPEAYAGMASSSQSSTAIGGENTGIRHRSLNMGGSLPNPVVGALMHSRLQRSVAREEQRSQATPPTPPSPNAVATGSDSRRGFQRWMASATGTSMTAHTNGRSSASSGNAGNFRANGSARPEQLDATSVANSPTLAVPAVTPSSSTSPSSEMKGAHTAADASLTSESSQGDGDGEEQPNAAKESRSPAEEESASEEASAASCVHHENASGRSTPVRSAEGAEGPSTSRRARKEKDKDRASTPQPSVTVALAMDDLHPHDPSRTSTPSPSPSSKGVRRKLKGLNAAAASLFKGKEKKT